MKKLLMTGVAAVALAGTINMASAAVPAEVADRLGKDLTPLGAEQAGNADGSIPAWTGGITQPPAGWKKGTHYVDPFSSDAPLYTITGQNLDQHRDKLSAGQIAMLTRHNTYKMDVYQSRRTCANTEASYQRAKENAISARLEEGGNGVGGAILTTPFPVPNNALEVAWNHMLRYRPFQIAAQSVNIIPTTGGSFVPTVVQTDTIINYSNPAVKTTAELNNISVYILFNTIAPARLAGNVTLVHETLNQAAGPRNAWQYSPGTRRVRRAPNISYDNPGTNSDGLSTSDSFDGYNGAPDRYNWTVLGKREQHIAYNNYKTQEEGLQYKTIIQPGHVQQDLVRYELHRVWQIEATLKQGARHVYSRRAFSLDEDTWSISTGDLYDGRGELWRTQEVWQGSAYDHPVCVTFGQVDYDIDARRYIAGGLRSEEKPVNYDAAELQVDRYTPDFIRRLGVR